MGFYSTQQLLKHECFNKVIDYLGAVLSLSAKTVLIVSRICGIVNSFYILFLNFNRILGGILPFSPLFIEVKALIVIM